MPYLKKEEKLAIAKQEVDAGSFVIPTSPGQLNYMFTVLCKRYLESQGVKYQTLNDCIGALEGAKLELYRRLVSSYEEMKIKDNGDVY